jgi:hypothetical protein
VRHDIAGVDAGLLLEDVNTSPKSIAFGVAITISDPLALGYSA